MPRSGISGRQMKRRPPACSLALLSASLLPTTLESHTQYVVDSRACAESHMMTQSQSGRRSQSPPIRVASAPVNTLDLLATLSHTCQAVAHGSLEKLFASCINQTSHLRQHACAHEGSTHACAHDWNWLERALSSEKHETKAHVSIAQPDG